MRHISKSGAFVLISLVIIYYLQFIKSQACLWTAEFFGKLLELMVMKERSWIFQSRPSFCFVQKPGRGVIQNEVMTGNTKPH